MPGENSFQRMQEEAARRMREMQSRARTPSHRAAPAPPPPEPAVSQNEPQPVQNETPSSPQEAGPEPQSGLSDGSQKSLLENLFQDKERTIILALLILLSNDGDHHELMFALMFLLM